MIYAHAFHHGKCMRASTRPRWGPQNMHTQSANEEEAFVQSCFQRATLSTVVFQASRLTLGKAHGFYLQKAHGFVYKIRLSHGLCLHLEPNYD